MTRSMFEPIRSVAARYQWVDNPYRSHARLAQLVPAGSEVLDVGCSTGYLASRLAKHKSCVVDGVEYDPAAAAEAQTACRRLFPGDALDVLKSLSGSAYDCLVFGDILEHLPRPDLVLAEARRLVRAHGRIVVSLPNVAVAPVRLMLALGFWAYLDTGVMDRTHLRFFTRRSARRLLEDAGFRVVRSYPTPHPPIDRLRWLGYSMTVLCPELMALQFVMEAVPEDSPRCGTGQEPGQSADPASISRPAESP